MESFSPEIETYLTVAQIYSNLDREEILHKAAIVQSFYNSTLEIGLIYYLQHYLFAPYQYSKEICELGRPLSRLELELLNNPKTPC